MTVNENHQVNLTNAMRIIGLALLGSRMKSSFTPPPSFNFDESFLGTNNNDSNDDDLEFFSSNKTANAKSTATSSKLDSKYKIPRIIHQSYKTSSLPSAWSSTPSTWKSLHPKYEYKFWTDEDNRNLIKNHYPWFLKTYDSYSAPIQRADAARYFAVMHYGGIYADLDIFPLKDVTPLLEWLESTNSQLLDNTDSNDSEVEYKEMIVAETYNIGLTNALFASIPNSTSLQSFTRALPNYTKPLYGFEPLIPHFGVLLSTGPTRFWIFLNNGFRGKVLTLNPAGWGQCHQCRQQTGKCIPQENSFFSTTVGGSWHKWDTRIMNFMFCRAQFVIWGGVCLIALLFQICRKRRIESGEKEIECKGDVHFLPLLKGDAKASDTNLKDKKKGDESKARTRQWHGVSSGAFQSFSNFLIDLKVVWHQFQINGTFVMCIVVSLGLYFF